MTTGKAKQSRRFTDEGIQQRLQANPSLRAANPDIALPGNPAVTAPSSPATGLLTYQERQDTPKAKNRGKKRREMNATEREFSLLLKRRVQEGEFSSVDYESLTLRWGEGASLLSYTPDFAAITLGAFASDDLRGMLKITLFEIKGAHAWKQDIVRFKAARNHFINFDFQLWEKGSSGWINTI